MAKVFVKVVGADRSIQEAETVGELKQELGLESYTATVNGEEASDDQALDNDDLVAFAKAVKGGN